MFNEALAALAAGATVVTPTRRLAGAIERAFDAARSAEGERAWRTPDVLSWSAWQQRSWAAAQLLGDAPLPLLLKPEQERALWERIIGDAHGRSALLDVEATAEAASTAWSSACAWRVGPLLRRVPLSEEGRAFLGWSEAFTHFCSRAELLDRARLPDRLADLLRGGALAAPGPLALYGFDGSDPQRDELIDALRGAGTRVDLVTRARPQAPARLFAAQGVQHEIRAAGRWARAILERAPGATIGIVVPDLERLRPDIARVLDEELLPDAVLAPGEERARPWNVSLGLPLAHWPVAHAALLLLDLAGAAEPGGTVQAATVGLLLRSPFLGGGQSERHARALLDRRLRQAGDPRVGIEILARFARDESRLSACPLLLERLQRLRARARDCVGAVLPPSAWAPRLQALLAAMGWPGERTLDTEEYQALEAWRELLADLSQLDPIVGAIGFDAARALLRRLAGQRLFQPRTPPVPVQVMGLLESEALEFDHLWVMGLHAEAWPRPVHPNPLLPVELQRRLGLPAGSPEWELAFAQRMLATWRCAAPQVVLSFPQTEDDRTLLPSPLVAELPRVLDPVEGASPPGLRELLHAARRLEELEDVQGSVLPLGATFTGGARLLLDQAACPFRAFAAHRLGARGLEQTHEGLDPRERGNLLHAALTVLWAGLRDSDALLALEDGALGERVAGAVAEALQRGQRKRGAPLPAGFLALERERLCELLLEWLRLERVRAPFEVVGTEQPLAADLGGLHLELRADRVDRLRDEARSQLLIDYKTGDAAVKAWFGARPDEPQLPLYALASDPPPAGLAFARVRRGQCDFAGLTALAGQVPGVEGLPQAKRHGAAADWPAQLAQWRAALDALAEQFRTGPAPVDPKAYPHTCRFCDLATLCRVSELRDAAEADEADADAQDD